MKTPSLKKSSSATDLFELISKDSKARHSICSQSLMLFGLYYFRHYFTHENAEFHYDVTNELMFSGEHQHILEVIHRDSAKTVWAKIKLVHNIVYKRKFFNLYVCFDKSKAEGHLFDIALELQTNKRIINDFGQLFYDDDLVNQKKTRKKSIGEFITGNGVKVMAMSTGQSTRGLIHSEYRPDFYIIDDFENVKTYRSKQRTAQVIDFIDELLGGISVDANVVFLANRITLTGSVAYIEAKAQEDHKIKVIDVPIYNELTKEIAWPARFVHTDAEADAINSQIQDSKHWVISIESKVRLLGTSVFNRDYLNKPTSAETQVIKEPWVVDNYYTTVDFKQMEMNLMVDPAAGETEQSDEFALGIVGWRSGDAHRYVIENQGWRALKLTDKAYKIIVYWLKYRQWITRVGIEVVMNQTALYQIIREWCNGSNVIPGLDEITDRNMPLCTINPNGLNKLERLRSQEPKFERGEIHLKPFMIKLKDQLISMPDALNDDRADVLVYNLEESYRGGTAYNPTEGMKPNSDDERYETYFAGIRKKVF